jgi:two-component system KDP operon response regulator KdpE
MRVLVIGQTPRLQRSLTRSGHQVMLASPGSDGVAAAATDAPDVVLLVSGMPGAEGLALCRRLRETSRVPIIVLSARSPRRSGRDAASALDLGADDYVRPPFRIPELLARMRAVLRRYRDRGEPAPRVLAAGELEIDFHCRRVTLGGREAHLTPTEYDLLCRIALAAGRVMTYRQLIDAIWGGDSPEMMRTLRMHVVNLRHKIEPDPARPRIVRTVPCVGYRLGS